MKAFRLADNKVGEIAEWDIDLLNGELDSILDLDMSDFGFNLEELSDEDLLNENNPYTMKVKIPQYEIKGEMPELFELVDENKSKELIEKINKSNVSAEQKEFLRKAAQRHLQFNYSKIAEYYAHQEKEMQLLMEDSALVIIDINDAIAKGYAQLSADIEKEISGDEDE